MAENLLQKLNIGGTDYSIQHRNFYGTCSTAAGTAAKVISLADSTGFALEAGTMITVKFSYTNSAANPTFNVASSGAKSVWYNTSAITSSNKAYAGTANRPMNFVFDGTYWVFVGWSYDADTTYSAATTSSAGLLSAADKTKLDGIADGANAYTHPSHTAGTAGTSSTTSGSTLAVPYVTYDAQGHVTGSGTHTHTVSGFATSDHTHTTTIATSTGTSELTLAHGTKYALTAGGDSFVFTMPSDNNTNYYHTTGSWSGLTYTATANGGAGELKFTIPTGTTSTTVAVGNHTHSGYLTSHQSIYNLTIKGAGTAVTTFDPNSAANSIDIVAGANVTVTPDATNKKITIAATDTVYTHPASHAASMITGLATVATSGSYNDLSNKPSIPSGAAASKGVDTSISAASTSTNLPTSKAVAAFVEGKGYKTTDNNTTYTFATGDSNGQIKVTPSGGSAQNISVKGLGSAAYTASTAYATAAQGTLASNAMPKSGGTFTGVVKAQNNTSYTTKQVRNVFLIADGSSMPSGAANGDICFIYSN